MKYTEQQLRRVRGLVHGIHTEQSRRVRGLVHEIHRAADKEGLGFST